MVESNLIVSIIWLAEKLSEFDVTLEAGMVVMTGSFTKQYRFENSLEIEARFDPFGSVTAKLT